MGGSLRLGEIRDWKSDFERSARRKPPQGDHIDQVGLITRQIMREKGTEHWRSHEFNKSPQLESVIRIWLSSNSFDSCHKFKLCCFQRFQ